MTQRSLLGPVLLIVLGVLFLLRHVFPELHFVRFWPVLLIVIGFWRVLEYASWKGAGTNFPGNKQ